ncbi:hypothetical protein FNV43_RR26323 [Rhamnella rubrinervis]|uniref:Ninja-family protein n=1 Tax=Rhamnella rubrinervis TaxID=2594499 RepID=A0A8K0GJI6_9ROSA|nr:hypothetical protein FNV43_RR26323 [Rhamnella rubrinervis]
MENLSLQMEKYPRDLLQRFMCGSSENKAPGEEEDSEEVELNLGLSLGGRFGIDKDAKKKLTRSSSIAGTMPLVTNDEATTLPPVSYPSLIRTSSLPTETEEEWRKRKDLQTLRRMEAKRRRSEKQRSTISSAKSEKEGCFSEEDKLQQHQQHGGAASAKTLSSTVAPPFGLPTWAAAARQAVHGGGLNVMSKGKAGFPGDSGGLQGFGQPSSQGSMESQGGSSSGMSDLESKPIQGSSSCGEARSPAGNQLLQERSNQDLLGSSGTPKSENTLKKPDSAENRRREIGMSTLEDMPCVFTKGDGPNGRRIEGILYRYGKGEEVRIMCVCHGKFLSPAEFVKHAGGSDVAHPLRHIVVNPSSTSFS